MKFQIKDLKKLLLSIQQHNINAINIKSNKFCLTINKNIIKDKNPLISKQIIKKDNKLKNENIRSKESQNHSSETYFTIVSPMVGTFYSSPAPNEPCFVELYDVVQKQQTVCLIEAMKLMNEIESEVYGEIVEMLVKDGDIIDCGQALMRVKPINK